MEKNNEVSTTQQQYTIQVLVQKRTLKLVSAWRRYSHNQPLCRKSTKRT